MLGLVTRLGGTALPFKDANVHPLEATFLKRIPRTDVDLIIALEVLRQDLQDYGGYRLDGLDLIFLQNAIEYLKSKVR